MEGLKVSEKVGWWIPYFCVNKEYGWFCKIPVEAMFLLFVVFASPMTSVWLYMALYIIHVHACTLYSGNIILIYTNTIDCVCVFAFNGWLGKRMQIKLLCSQGSQLSPFLGWSVLSWDSSFRWLFRACQLTVKRAASHFFLSMATGRLARTAAPQTHVRTSFYVVDSHAWYIHSGVMIMPECTNSLRCTCTCHACTAAMQVLVACAERGVPKRVRSLGLSSSCPWPAWTKVAG